MCNEILENGRSHSQSKFTIYWKIKASLQLLMESIFFSKNSPYLFGNNIMQLWPTFWHCKTLLSTKSTQETLLFCFFFFFLELLKPDSLHPRQELCYWATVPIQRMLFYSSVIRYISTTTSPPSSHPSLPPPPSPPDLWFLHFPSGKSRPSRYFKQTWHNMMQ